MQNCNKCGSPVKVIPAGVSKKTGKPYDSFYKCEACGNSQFMTPKPQFQPKQPLQPTNGAEIQQLRARVEFAIGRIEELITIMTEPDEEVKIKDEKAEGEEKLPF